jgi:hypothetical protein
MFPRSISSPRRLVALLLLSAAGLLTLAGCGKDSDSPTGPSGPPTTTTMNGVMINANENGRLVVTIATTTLAPPPGAYVANGEVILASATYRPVGGGTVNMSGTYDADTDSLVLAGGGYSFATMLETDGPRASMVGEYAGPNGPGLFGAAQTDGANVTVHCGTYLSLTTAESGRLGVLANDDEFAGIMFSAQTSEFQAFEGMLSGTGTTRTVTGGGSEGVDSIAVSGTLNTVSGISSGTWTYLNLDTMSGDSGTWTATECP